MLRPAAHFQQVRASLLGRVAGLARRLICFFVRLLRFFVLETCAARFCLGLGGDLRCGFLVTFRTLRTLLRLANNCINDCHRASFTSNWSYEQHIAKGRRAKLLVASMSHARLLPVTGPSARHRMVGVTVICIGLASCSGCGHARGALSNREF